MLKIRIEINTTGTKELENILDEIEKLRKNQRSLEVIIVAKESSTM